MKELKISISDELYKELSKLNDKDSFLTELIENELKVSLGDEKSVDADSIADAPSKDGDDIDSVSGEVSGKLPEEAYFELEDTFKDEGSVEESEEQSLTLPCDGSLVDPDDLDGCAELYTDLDLEDMVRDEAKPAPDVVSFSEKEANVPVENIYSLQNIIFDLADRICELEKQIMDMNSSIQFIKERPMISNMAGVNVEGQHSSVVRSDVADTERTENPVPYATLSFPELKIPPELLDDIEDSSAGIEVKNEMGGQTESKFHDYSTDHIEEVSSKEPVLKPLLFDADFPVLASPIKAVGGPSVNAEKPKNPLPDETVPTTDKLESCIFAYLPSGSQVKKDVIKSLLSKRYADSEVESKIDNLLSAGRISNVVKDDRIYLMRVGQKKSV
ncbi:MAG: hypothetical protein ACQESU_03965 [Halobacteriota archaeon]